MVERWPGPIEVVVVGSKVGALDSSSAAFLSTTAELGMTGTLRRTRCSISFQSLCYSMLPMLALCASPALKPTQSSSASGPSDPSRPPAGFVRRPSFCKSRLRRLLPRLRPQDIPLFQRHVCLLHVVYRKTRARAAGRCPSRWCRRG